MLFGLGYVVCDRDVMNVVATGGSTVKSEMYTFPRKLTSFIMLLYYSAMCIQGVILY